MKQEKKTGNPKQEKNIQYVVKEKENILEKFGKNVKESAQKQVHDVKKASDMQRSLFSNKSSDMNLDYLFKPLVMFIGFIGILIVVIKIISFFKR
ncbi:hypothetical protein P7D73_18200 [Enterococcus raffinosus]|uniref:hypothetical protein n=1 Tax=Enterococcus raffinosus TaxID=71452 RepID=UPI0028912FCA|nr:hypothetical protein [Enterococcus raffinosus]MDT2525139.1 hypothetical protein [Enterococcus raffinosus]MDT2592494.1 hypothetical protein [Enterococcus raffinosus]